MKYKLTALLLFLAYVFMLTFPVDCQILVRVATLVFAGCVASGATLCYAIARSRPEVGDGYFALGLIEFVVAAIVLGLAYGVSPWMLRYSAVLIGALIQADGFLRIWRPPTVDTRGSQPRPR